MPKALRTVRPTSRQEVVNELMPNTSIDSREAMGYLRRKTEHLNVF